MARCDSYKLEVLSIHVHVANRCLHPQNTLYCCSLNEYCLHVFPSRHILIRQSYDFCRLHILGLKNQLARRQKAPQCSLSSPSMLSFQLPIFPFWSRLCQRHLCRYFYLFVDICFLLSSLVTCHFGFLDVPIPLHKFILSVWGYKLKGHMLGTISRQSTLYHFKV